VLGDPSGYLGVSLRLFRGVLVAAEQRCNAHPSAVPQEAVHLSSQASASQKAPAEACRRRKPGPWPHCTPPHPHHSRHRFETWQSRSWNPRRPQALTRREIETRAAQRLQRMFRFACRTAALHACTHNGGTAPRTNCRGGSGLDAYVSAFLTSTGVLCAEACHGHSVHDPYHTIHSQPPIAGGGSSGTRACSALARQRPVAKLTVRSLARAVSWRMRPPDEVTRLGAGAETARCRRRGVRRNGDRRRADNAAA
jgi:hypothetical protein